MAKTERIEWTGAPKQGLLVWVLPQCTFACSLRLWALNKGQKTLADRYGPNRKDPTVTATRQRVPLNSSKFDNARIQRALKANVAYFAEHRDQIADRLRELDEEWDIERAIEANAAVIGFAGVALAAGRSQRWLALPALVTGFLFQHAMRGWCPPVPILRKLGFRTSYEIEEERRALKVLRGDFRQVADTANEALRVTK